MIPLNTMRHSRLTAQHFTPGPIGWESSDGRRERSEAMRQKTKGCQCNKTNIKDQTRDVLAPETTQKEQQQTDIPVIIDHKVALLAAAGAAMTAECRPCLDDIMPELAEAGVSEADLRWAIENGQFSGANAELSTFALDQVYRADRSKKCAC